MTPLLATVMQINDALSVANALMPLVNNELNGGKPITEDDVKQALAGKDAALASFDAAIKAAGG